MNSPQSPYPGRKEIAATEVRFIPREDRRLGARKVVWEVYDKSSGSVGNVRFGSNVKMVHDTEAGAQAECDRLEGLR